MFPSPEMMVSEYMDQLGQEFRKRELIENMLEQYKEDALSRIGKICDIFYVDAIALTIASGYENETDSAIEIVNRLSLNDKHIAGLLNDPDMMEHILLDEAKQHEQDQQEFYGE